jgi:DNA mismatch endonuclease (patch repair protein)
MSRIRSTDTKPEIVVRKLLHALGYRFRLHGKVNTGSINPAYCQVSRILF